jgi:hypothetical protein
VLPNSEYEYEPPVADWADPFQFMLKGQVCEDVPSRHIENNTLKVKRIMKLLIISYQQ